MAPAALNGFGAHPAPTRWIGTQHLPRRHEQRHVPHRRASIEVDPAVTERLLHVLRTGNARVVAYRYAGISEPTFHRWMNDDRHEFREIQGVVEQREATAEVGVLVNLAKLSKRDHRAAGAWLERKAPERWRLDEPADDAKEMYPPGVMAQEPDP